MAGDEGDDYSDLVNEELALDVSDHPEDFVDLEELLSEPDLDPNFMNDVDPAVPE